MCQDEGKSVQPRPDKKIGLNIAVKIISLLPNKKEYLLTSMSSQQMHDFSSITIYLSSNFYTNVSRAWSTNISYWNSEPKLFKFIYFPFVFSFYYFVLAQDYAFYWHQVIFAIEDDVQAALGEEILG